jgi:hypothetical protein
MRIIRTILLLTGAAVFMPSPPEGAPAGSGQGVAAVDSGGLLVSAAAAVSDVVSFCARQPEVCKTAGYVAGRLEAKAKYSVRLIYEWANESGEGSQLAPADLQAAADPLETGSSQRLALAAAGGQSTLRLDDLIPEWRGPLPQNKG